jgi:hypothetical protein
VNFNFAPGEAFFSDSEIIVKEDRSAAMLDALRGLPSDVAPTEYDPLAVAGEFLEAVHKDELGKFDAEFDGRRGVE